MTVLATLMGNVEARTEKQMSQEVYRIRLINSKEIELPYDPGIPLFGVYPKAGKKHQFKDIHAALFTIAKTWKQPIYPLTDEWI